jgi:hypothetical protein
MSGFIVLDVEIFITVIESNIRELEVFLCQGGLWTTSIFPYIPT